MADGELQDWYAVRRAALKAGNKEDAEFALQQIDRLNQSATEQEVQQEGLYRSPDTGEIEERVSPVLAGLQGAAESASFGLGSFISPRAREFTRHAQEQHPYITTAGRVAGAFAGPVAELGAAKAGLNVLRGAPRVVQAANMLAARGNPLRVIGNPLLRNVLTGAGTGATIGGISSAAEAEPGQRLAAAQSGAETGAVFGAAAPIASVTGLALLGGAKKAGQKFGGLTRYAVEGERGTVPVGPRSARVPTPKPPSQEDVLARIQQHGRTQGRPLTASSAYQTRQIRPENHVPPEVPEGPVGRLLSSEEVATRRAERAQSLEAPTYQRRGQLTPPSFEDRFRKAEPTTPETAAVQTAEAPHQAPPTGTGLETGITREEQASKGARGLTQHPFTHGPGKNPMPPDVEATISQSRAQRMSTPEGYRMHHRPFVPPTAEAGKAQLATLRGRAGVTASARGLPFVRIVETLDAPANTESILGLQKELLKASPWTVGQLTAWLQTHTPHESWAGVLQSLGTMP